LAAHDRISVFAAFAIAFVSYSFFMDRREADISTSGSHILIHVSTADVSTASRFTHLMVVLWLCVNMIHAKSTAVGVVEGKS
jgi:hypothetical protein